MAILGRFIQQPVEKLDYEFDFIAWLADRADTISGTPTVVSAPLTVGATNMTISNITTSGGVVRFFATGGTHAVKYEMTCTFATTGGRIKQDELVISVKES